jgi:hypothetical protein
MRKRRCLLITVLFVSGCFTLLAQPTENPYKAVDEFVKSVGKLDSLNMGAISNILTRNFSDNKDKARAIFTWIALNIALDCKATRNGDQERIPVDLVLKRRTATAFGYASLYQDMCSVAKIRCLTVDGYGKTSTEQVGEKPDAFNHSWVVVQLGQSPDTWQYADPAWGSGYTDEKKTRFTPSFQDAYFFPDKTLFNLQHFPDNKAWQLGSGPRSLKEFMDLPVVYSAAYRFKAGGFNPASGLIKSKVNRKEIFSMKLSTAVHANNVAIETGTDKKKKRKEVPFRQEGNVLSFTCSFEEADSFPLCLLINNEPVAGYRMELEE